MRHAMLLGLALVLPGFGVVGDGEPSPRLAQPKPDEKKPWAGPPKAEWLNTKLLTFQRLPKADEVIALKIGPSINKVKAHLSAASFPALLDSMKPVKADDENYRWHLAPWHSIQFETPEGKFEAQLYLGGLAFLTAPDGSTGLVTFVHPVVAPPPKQGKKE